MSGLFAALKIGMKALQAAEAAQRVVGHNVANANTDGYTRQRAELVTGPADITSWGPMGTGVEVARVSRLRDAFIDVQMRNQLADQGLWDAVAEIMERVELALGEPGDQGISAALSEFFAVARTLSQPDQTDNPGVRATFMEAAESLALAVRELRSGLEEISADIEDEISRLASQVTTTAAQIASLSDQIARMEAQYGPANDLRDRRDALVEELASMVDLSAWEGDDGVFRVTVGGVVLVEGSRSEAVEYDESSGELCWADTGMPVEYGSGRVGGLHEVLEEQIPELVAELDTFARALLTGVNLLHAQGLQLDWATELTGACEVASLTAPLSDTEASGLILPVSAGELTVVVSGPGGETETTVAVGASETAASLAAKLDLLEGVSASVVAGRLVVTADPGYGFKIGRDSSGALAALGLGTIFVGDDASSLDVNGELVAAPGLICAGRNGEPGDASIMRAIGDLEAARVVDDRYTLEEALETMVSRAGASARQAAEFAENRATVVTMLRERRESVSGVSLDEEMTDMLRYQRAYVAAARFISTVDEMLAVLVGELKR